MERIDRDKLPKHIAIIMDGNGRWATKNSMNRVLGHRKGAEAVRAVVKTCRKLGIKYLTLYAFSVENWLRPKEEVRALTALLKNYLEEELNEMMDNNIRLMAIGDIDALAGGVKTTLCEAIEKTSGNQGMCLNLALSYGGRDEIVDGVKKIARDIRSGTIKEDTITKDMFSQYLYFPEMPDPDLLIRTSGEYRLSNFLIWQLAYTELYFTDVLWPDFSREHLLEAIADYQRRERRFGMTSEQLSKD
ncbi:MAG: isoprenyl transferase [Deltaproteobacteria bacterium]|jgi:undecaprenyl diphosphate synthase|nr:isoprenyl transferase [Deltaproteobacteria bacterium]MBN2846443.1 isoprenyl transferase [Deltaproteobacteria bacterium]